MQKKKITKKQRNAIIAVVLAVAVVAGICYVAFKPEDKLKVETVNVSCQSVSATLDTTGKVSAASQDAFVIPSGAKLLTLNVKEGDIVEAGDIIATFDLTSLNDALRDKENAYKKAESAYNDAVKAAGDSKSKIAQVKKQIAELEAEIARLQDKADSTVQKPVVNAPTVKVSDSLVKRFVKLAKLFGVEYTNDEAEKVLVNMLSAGSSMSDISSMMDNLSSFAGTGSFDFSSLSAMTGSSELMSAEMSLIQLKSQLATLELQSDSTYISAFKTIADKARESYIATKAQVDSMRNGWIAKDKGIISEVNVSLDGEDSANAQTQEFDISSILSAVTSGADVTSLLSSFMGNAEAAVRILYYPLVADISLSKYDILDVDMNQDVIIESASGKEFAGKVSYISTVATSSNGLNIGSIMGSSNVSSTIPAQVTIEEADRSVIVGVDVQVSVITDTIENALVVPVEAICIDGEDVFVYVLDDGVAKKTNVELGISSDTHYQILSGLTEKDVLIKNTLGLEDGVKVETK